MVVRHKGSHTQAAAHHTPGMLHRATQQAARTLQQQPLQRPHLAASMTPALVHTRRRTSSLQFLTGRTLTALPCPTHLQQLFLAVASCWAKRATSLLTMRGCYFVFSSVTDGRCLQQSVGLLRKPAVVRAQKAKVAHQDTGWPSLHQAALKQKWRRE